MKEAVAITLGAGAYAAALAALNAPGLDEQAAFLYAMSGGLLGGMVASLAEDVDPAKSSWQIARGLLAKTIASGLAAPALVYGGMTYAADGAPVVYSFFPVMAWSGIAGLVAWPAWAKLSEWINKIKPADVIAWWRGRGK